MIGSRRLGFRTFEKDADRLGTELFGGDDPFPPGPIGTAAWNHIHLIPPNGATVTSYPVTGTGLTDALTAATVAGSMIWVPPGSFNTAITIPANIALVALGEKVSINGQWTLNSGVVVANVVQTQSGSSAGALSGVVGPSSGIAYMKNCSITVENSGVGDAYAINQSGAGELWLWGCATYGNASGGGSGYGARQSAGTLYVSDDGRHRGSTGKFSGTVQLFSFDDVIKLKTSTFTQLYNATAAGVAAMIAGASSGDRAAFPQHIDISLTSGITVPAGVTLERPNLSFSGFSGVGVDMSEGSRLEDYSIDYDGTGQASATAIRSNGLENCVITRGSSFARNATTNIGAHLIGSALGTGRVNITNAYALGEGGTTAIGFKIEDEVRSFGNVAGEARDGASKNVGVQLEVDSLSIDDFLLHGWAKATGTGSYGLEVVANHYGRVGYFIAQGDTKDVLINSGAELQAYGLQFDSITNSGTLTHLLGTEAYPSANWFNVKDFGAVGDGVTDDTTEIQAAIDACETAGGGVVYFPRGIYVVGGALQDTLRANAQLLLPSVNLETEQPIGITFLGEHIPAFNVSGGTPYAQDFESGSIIKGTLNAGAGGAMIGGMSSAASSYDFTRIRARFENLTLRMPSNPVLTAANLNYVAQVQLVNVAFDVGADTDVQSLTEPTTATSYALKTPANDNGAFTYIQGVRAVGYYNGIEVNEHSIIDEIFVTGCKIAFVFEFGHHASLMKRILVGNCTYGMKFNGNHQVDVLQYDFEHSQLSVWYTTVYDIDDASDLGSGRVNYHGVLGGTGKGEAFVKNGGRRITISRIGAKQPPVYWEPGVAAGGDTIMFMANNGDVCMMREEVNNG